MADDERDLNDGPEPQDNGDISSLPGWARNSLETARRQAATYRRERNTARKAITVLSEALELELDPSREDVDRRAGEAVEGITDQLATFDDVLEKLGPHYDANRPETLTAFLDSLPATLETGAKAIASATALEARAGELEAETGFRDAADLLEVTDRDGLKLLLGDRWKALAVRDTRDAEGKPTRVPVLKGDGDAFTPVLEQYGKFLAPLKAPPPQPDPKLEPRPSLTGAGQLPPAAPKSEQQEIADRAQVAPRF